MKAASVAVVLAALAVVGTKACTNYLLTAGATSDGSTQIAYAADDAGLYGSLGHIPAGSHPAGTMRDIWDWDSSVYLGQIAEAPYTYNVIGNMNEHQLTIGETTFGGLPSLGNQPGAVLDYGNLIWVTLQRATNAREAIALFGNLTAQYGYYSQGESFSIADPNEVWVLEMIGKGPGEKGAVWVAVKIPDGHVSAHANQARIRTFPLNDPSTCIYAPDVISFAVRKGLYPASAPASEFSFSDVYDPVNFDGARFCETRVWAFFRQVASGMDQYLDYVQGYNLTNRMPLSVPVTRKVGLNDTFWLHRTHFEGTWFDNTGAVRPDVGAGGFGTPVRWRPLEWTYQGESYVNERTVAIQQTGWHFVAQMRSWLPNEIGGIFWFGVDDTSHAAHIPVYCSATKIPKRYGDVYGQTPQAGVSYGVDASAATFSFDSAWWVFNLVANYAYDRYSLISPEIQTRIVAVESAFFNATQQAEVIALALLKQNPADAIAYLTEFSCKTGDELVKEWLVFFTQLFLKYRDGLINTPTAQPPCQPGQKVNCTGRPMVDSGSPGYPDQWYGRIVAENGDHYRVPASAKLAATKKEYADKKKLI